MTILQVLKCSWSNGSLGIDRTSKNVRKGFDLRRFQLGKPKADVSWPLLALTGRSFAVLASRCLPTDSLLSYQPGLSKQAAPLSARTRDAWSDGVAATSDTAQLLLLGHRGLDLQLLDQTPLERVVVKLQCTFWRIMAVEPIVANNPPVPHRCWTRYRFDYLHDYHLLRDNPASSICSAMVGQRHRVRDDGRHHDCHTQDL